ncbi:Inner membrane protein YoaE [uncultured Pleomorphomonas sp.]|uniref:Inner membrane protein YoaE n=1 Tax=uncultured Pleomorphomonas sp. TaxID=442121 RepID=A0A212KYV5_9HYPH|nr:TerC family protein [uncultured Pleomorphomonas sp.]SCM70309.1 Inner membrane protein YoaE [uncultured Pleomorphomonas sp.]
MLDLVFNANAWASLLTLTVMEIVLGIDNLVFISVLTSRLPTDAARKARALGLSMALIFRVLLLITLSWLIGLTAPVFSLFGHGFSWRDLILLAGGLFLLYKATHEIHAGIEGEEDESGNVVHAAFGATVAQIIAIDIVFSIDSIITAIGMAEHVPVMILAVVIAMIIMFIASEPISKFIHDHPTTKMLALSFLLLIGVSLVADGVGFHVPRAYIYFAMAFSAGVEMINILAGRKRRKANAGA